MRILLFARTYQQAKNFLYDVDPVVRRDYVVVLSYRYLRGFRAESAIFLEDWWRDWSPGDAYEVCMLLNLFYGVEGMWEQSDSRRRGLARKQIGLTGAYESDFAWFDLQVRSTAEEDCWISSATRLRFQRMLDEDRNVSGILRSARRLSALPGLDDKKRTIRPFLGTFEDQYGEPLSHV